MPLVPFLLRRGGAPAVAGAGKIALQDSGALIKGFDLTHAECECDSRFQELYLAGTWTGTYVNGSFRNYCDPDYYLADKGAANCPTGWARIVDLDECRTAIAHLALGDATEYENGQLGADKFPGCANNALNNRVAFNRQNTAATDFALSASEQYVCKKSERAFGTTAAAGQADVKGSMELSVSDPAAFVADAGCKDAVRETLAAVTGAPKESVTVWLSVLAARRLDGDARRLAGSVSVAYTIERAPPAALTALRAATAASMTTKVSSSVAAKVGAGRYTVAVTEIVAPGAAETTTVARTTAAPVAAGGRMPHMAPAMLLANAF